MRAVTHLLGPPRSLVRYSQTSLHGGLRLTLVRARAVIHSLYFLEQFQRSVLGHVAPSVAEVAQRWGGRTDWTRWRHLVSVYVRTVISQEAVLLVGS